MSNTTKRVVIGEAVVLVAWLIVMFACHNILMRPTVFFSSLLFGVLAFIVSTVSMALADRQGGSSAMAETSYGLPVVASVGLFAVLLVANTVFCLASFAWISTTPVVIVNVVILAIMVLVRMGLDSHARTAQANVATAAAKTRTCANFSSLLGALLAQAQDPEVSSALLALKEEVSMSSNVSQPPVRDLEDTFAAQLASVEASIQSGAQAKQTLDLVSQARATWRKRNAALTSIK